MSWCYIYQCIFGKCLDAIFTFTNAYSVNVLMHLASSIGTGYKLHLPMHTHSWEIIDHVIWSKTKDKKRTTWEIGQLWNYHDPGRRHHGTALINQLGSKGQIIKRAKEELPNIWSNWISGQIYLLPTLNPFMREDRLRSRNTLGLDHINARLGGLEEGEGQYM